MEKTQSEKDVKANRSLEEATRKWTGEFVPVPISLIEKAYLNDNNFDDIREITPVSKYNWVHIFNGKHDGKEGTVIEIDGNQAKIELENSKQTLEDIENLEVQCL